MTSTMAEELRQMCRREPFQPFRVHVKNGKRFDVLDPLECMVGEIALVLPVHDPVDSDRDYPAFLDVYQVVRVEPITATPTNGLAS
jgi:hypothetical protein